MAISKDCWAGNCIYCDKKTCKHGCHKEKLETESIECRIQALERRINYLEGGGVTKVLIGGVDQTVIWKIGGTSNMTGLPAGYILPIDYKKNVLIGTTVGITTVNSDGDTVYNQLEVYNQNSDADTSGGEDTDSAWGYIITCPFSAQGFKIATLENQYGNTNSFSLIDLSTNDTSTLRPWRYNFGIYTDGTFAVNRDGVGDIFSVSASGRMHANGGYASADNSDGITTTITTASLATRTITVKNGLITGFA